MLILLIVTVFWATCLALLWAWRGELFRRTWCEPYVEGTTVLIESDDWGPGPDLHAARLIELSEMLSRHRDDFGRNAVLTADMVLAIPDGAAIRESRFTRYARRFLDQGFERVLEALRAAIARGTVVPQLHGLEHLHGEGLVRLAAAGDRAVLAYLESENCTDWESLASPLQGHYVDGTRLPTVPLSHDAQAEHVDTAMEAFRRIFGIHSDSTVAPCYLWQDETEAAWARAEVKYVQTAGYRCVGRGPDGTYQQDPALIRAGELSPGGLIYLVRNAMYEPVDGKCADGCIAQAQRAIRQGLPVVISTHRYNYTVEEPVFRRSLEGLDRILTVLSGQRRPLRFISSPELGCWFAEPDSTLKAPAGNTDWPPLAPLRGLSRIRAFLARLWYRHAKLRIAAVVSGLIVPAALVVAAEYLLREGRGA